MVELVETTCGGTPVVELVETKVDGSLPATGPAFSQRLSGQRPRAAFGLPDAAYESAVSVALVVKLVSADVAGWGVMCPLDGEGRRVMCPLNGG